ncbi:MAG: MotA/TolQ/ExbB proton channel family protein [bacterium]
MSTLILPSIFSGAVWQIIQNTSVFGKFILIVLIGMSLISWVVIFHKWRQFRHSSRAGHAFLSSFKRSGRLADAIGQAKSQSASPLAKTFLAGYEELTSLDQLRNEGGALQSSRHPLEAEDFEIIEMTMERTVTEEIGRLEHLVVVLATTGNSAPFLGLLGTVVGIMGSFWEIGEMGSASLAVVAPGIAEALLATIIGLAAAIPAVIAYNWANSQIKIANDAAGGFILGFLARARKESR